MPFCPKCKGEFQDWVKTCLDCGVPLVDKLPPDPEKKDPKYSEEPLVPVATYTYPAQADLATAKLVAWGIPAFTTDASSQYYIGGPSLGGIKVMVRESDLMQATMALKDNTNSISEEAPAVSEPDYYRCPQCNSTNVSLKCGDCGHEWHEEEPNEPEESES
jgi:hypothetical protein